MPRLRHLAALSLLVACGSQAADTDGAAPARTLTIVEAPPYPPIVRLGPEPTPQTRERRRRLHEEQGIDPDPVITDGQLVVMDEAVSAGFMGLPAAELTGLVTTQVEEAIVEGYRGVRLTGLYPQRGSAPMS